LRFRTQTTPLAGKALDDSHALIGKMFTMENFNIDNSSLLALTLVLFGMAFSGFVGVLLGQEDVLLEIVAALWAFG